MVRLVSHGRKLQPSTRAKLTPRSKVADSIYSDPRFKVFRSVVVKRAGYRCEYRDPQTNERCTKAAPRERVLADHIIEIKDGGAPFDPANGQCHCVQHNTKKGVLARAARHSEGRGV